MQYCPKCKVNIRGNKAGCPLCQGHLTQTPEDPAFPVLKRNKVTSITIIRVSAFAFLTLEIIMAAIWYLSAHELGHGFPWVPIVMAGGVAGWVDLLLALYLRNNVLKIITAETYIAMVIDLVIDRMTGFIGWSVIWMIPVTFIGLAAATLSIGMGTRMRLEDYIIYLAADAVFCMLQIIHILNGMNHFIWPAAICIVLYMIMTAGALVFRSRDLKNASAKYFNV